MKRIIKIMTKWVLVSVCLILTSCCDRGNEYYYFPAEAINYYNKYDTILFQDTLTGTQEIHVICKRDTGLSVFEWGGWCGYEDYNYSKIYFLTKDSCSGNVLFHIDISPDTIIEVGFFQLDNRTKNIFYTSNFKLSPKNSIKLCGFTYDDVITMKSHGLNDGTPILFNLKYGIIQYSHDNNTFNLINYDF